MAQDTFDLDIPGPPQADPPDSPEILPEPAAPPPRNRGRRVMLAGVAGACLLGAGLGLWARPAEGERQLIPQGSRPKVVAAQPTRQIQIVLDETPAPIGPPMEVMRAAEGAAISIAPVPAAPEPIAPIRPPAGLVRVLTTPLPLETAELPAAPPARRDVEVRKPPAEKAEPAPSRKAESPARKKADARAERKKDALRKAEAEKPKASKAETKVAKRKSESESKTKLANAAKTEKARKEKLRSAKAEKDEAAAVKSKKKTSAKSEGKTPSRLASAVKKAIHKTPKSEVAEKSAKLKLADARKAEKAKADKAKAAKARVEKAEAAPPRKAPQVVKGGGPLRMVSNRCASTDPGAALVCADAALGAAERRLNRAYQRAEAAGVSANELRRQQQRWLAARAAAAREAPWAVQDVYQARIAELEDLTRDAAQGY